MFIAVSDGVQSNTSRQPLEQSDDVLCLFIRLLRALFLPDLWVPA